jgi:hypothetical protein
MGFYFANCQWMAKNQKDRFSRNAIDAGQWQKTVYEKR